MRIKRNFLPGWIPTAVVNDCETSIHSAFQFCKDEIFYSHYKGDYAAYSGTGYITALPDNRIAPEKYVNDLMESKWIDRYIYSPRIVANSPVLLWQTIILHI